MAKMKKGESHGLGFGKGSIIDYGDGLIEYRQTGKIMPAFQLNVADVTGVTVRKATREDQKLHGASGLQQMIVIQGGGTELAACAVNYGTADKIESWIKAHPAFGAASSVAPVQPASGSVADELLKLAQLRDAGVLTEAEFVAQKASLLG